MDMRLEQRLSPRRNTMIPAEIIFANDRRSCIIRNISDGGAKLELIDIGPMPQYFLLAAPGFEARGCRVAWRAMHELGVQFTDTGSAFG